MTVTLGIGVVMSKQQFGRTFSSLEEFAEGFGEAFIAANDAATASVRKQEREREARTVRSGVTFVPAPVEEGETDWARLRRERKAEEAVVAENQRVAARAMAQVAKRSGMSDAARKSRMGRLS